MKTHSDGIDRRTFVKLSALTGGLAMAPAILAEGEAAPPEAPGLERRPLGKTGLEVSAVAFGTYGMDNPQLVTAALERGINLFCTCADYQDGRAERALGQAIRKLGSRREGMVLHTGTKVRRGTSKQAILDTIDTSLKRLGTDHVEVFRTHNVTDVENLLVDELFEAFEAAKKAGKVRFLGLSGHKGGLEDCLAAAIDDGRFDVIMCRYDFVSYPGQATLFARAAEKGMGTIVFKTKAGAREKEIKDLEKGGLSFTQATVRWALSNAHVSAVAAGIGSFRDIEEFAGAASGKLSRAELEMLERYAHAMHDQYCRFCAQCEGACPHGVAVAEVNRYRMYFRHYGREKDAMGLYAALPAGARAAACSGCGGECAGSCPFRRDVRGELMRAHAELTLPGPETLRA